MVQGKKRQSMKRSPEKYDGKDHQTDERSVRSRMPIHSDLQSFNGQNGCLKIARNLCGLLMSEVRVFRLAASTGQSRSDGAILTSYFPQYI